MKNKDKKFKRALCGNEFMRADIHLAVKKQGNRVSFKALCSGCLVKESEWVSTETGVLIISEW